MKKNTFFLALFLLGTFSLILSCAKKTEQVPCDGYGILNIENKLDSAVTINIVEARTTVTLLKDYTMPFSLTGNNPYTVKVYGSTPIDDTTFMILPCDNKLYIIKEY
jgi:hypothetical protein